MRKPIFFVVLLFSLFHLYGCDHTVESESLLEAKIIDENLKLKNQIAEMETEQALKEKQKNIENEVQRELFVFFQDVMTGKIERAKNMVADHIEVAPSHLTLNDGRKVYFQDNDSYIISIPESEWDGKDSIRMSVEIFNHQGTSNIEVCLYKEDGAWKIDDIIM